MKSDKIRFLILMSVFGMMGPLVRGIDLPSSAIACLRAWLSAVALSGYILLSGKKYDRTANMRVLKPMLLAGVCIAIDWIGLFEAYKYTTIATATVFYYTAPVIVFLVSPLLLGERFTAKHLLCAVTAFAGMIFVSGMADSGIPALADIKGILFALFGAAGYATIILINKKCPGGDPIIRTLIQLATAAVITTPYVLATENVRNFTFSAKSITFLLILAIGFTALTYIFYFDLILKIPARTVAMFSYADPILAVLISVFILSEPFTPANVIGTVLIIGAALVSEIKGEKKS